MGHLLVRSVYYYHLSLEWTYILLDHTKSVNPVHLGEIWKLIVLPKANSL